MEYLAHVGKWLKKMTKPPINICTSVTRICDDLKGACLGDAGVGLGKDHLDHVQGDREEGPLLVHLLQLAQLAGIYDGLPCAPQPSVKLRHSSVKPQ